MKHIQMFPKVFLFGVTLKCLFCIMGAQMENIADHELHAFVISTMEKMMLEQQNLYENKLLHVQKKFDTKLLRMRQTQLMQANTILEQQDHIKNLEVQIGEIFGNSELNLKQTMEQTVDEKHKTEHKEQKTSKKYNMELEANQKNNMENGAIQKYNVLQEISQKHKMERRAGQKHNTEKRANQKHNIKKRAGQKQNTENEAIEKQTTEQTTSYQKSNINNSLNSEEAVYQESLKCFQTPGAKCIPAKPAKNWFRQKLMMFGESSAVQQKVLPKSMGHKLNGANILKQRDHTLSRLKRNIPEVIAFSAYLDHPVDHVGIGQTVKCNRIIVNDGQGYNPYTGVFMAPRTGTYFLTFHIDTNKMRAEINAKLVIDGTNEAGAVSSFHVMGSNSVVVHIDVGQSAWIETLLVNDVELTSYEEYKTVTFSGFLLY